MNNISYRNSGASNSKVGNATQAQVLSGKTFTNASGVGLTGTMTNQGSWTNTPTASTKVKIPAGYHNGSGYVDTATVYTNGYNAGVTDADARANASSVNYQTGYNAGVVAADGRANTSSVNYQTGYNAGVVAGKNSKTLTISMLYLYCNGNTNENAESSILLNCKDFSLLKVGGWEITGGSASDANMDVSVSNNDTGTILGYVGSAGSTYDVSNVNTVKIRIYSIGNTTVEAIIKNIVLN